MSRDSEVNRQFGIYRSVCCRAEIVIPEGVTFPQCAKHYRTEWQDVTDMDCTETEEQRLASMGELAELLHQNRPSR
jgi:hypothetical protein